MGATNVVVAVNAGAFSRPGVPENARVPPGTTPAADEGEHCAARLGALYDQLVDAAGHIFTGDGWPTPGSTTEWTEWSGNWLEALELTRSRCRLRESRPMKPIAQLADQLERLHLAYTTALHGFSDVGRKQLAQVQAAFERLGVRPGSVRPARRFETTPSP